MRSPRNQSGYTLLELMVVVALVGIMAALAVPGMTRGLRERRKVRAAHDVVRTLLAARRAAIGNGRAHLVRFDEAGDDGRGSLEIFRGDSNRCNGEDWAAATEDTCADNLRCNQQDSWDADRYQSNGSSMQLRLVNDGFGAAVDLCFDGTGVLWWRDGQSGLMSDIPTLDDGSSMPGAFEFQVKALVDGADPGVVRRVFLPFGGPARYVQ